MKIPEFQGIAVLLLRVDLGCRSDFPIRKADSFFPFSIVALEPEGGAADPEKDLAMARMANNVVASGGKILLYTGLWHALTLQGQAGYIPGGKRPPRFFRMGQLLVSPFNQHPFVICLHQPFPKKYWFEDRAIKRALDAWWLPSLHRQGMSLPFSGTLDQVFNVFSKPIGFDTCLPFLEDLEESFAEFANPSGGISLKTFCNGYVYLNPFNENHHVRPLENISQSEEDRKTIRSSIEFLMRRYRFPGVPEMLHEFSNHESAKKYLEKEGLTEEWYRDNIDFRGLESIFKEKTGEVPR